MQVGRIWSHCWKAVFTPFSPQEIICREGRTVAFETDFVPFYWLHKSPVSQMPWAWMTQLSSLFYNDHTVSFLTAQYRYHKAELSRDTGGFLGASGISLRMSKEHFTKGESHGHCSAAWVEATTWNAPHRFCLSWVLLLDFCFFLIFLKKGIWAWHAEMER